MAEKRKSRRKQDEEKETPTKEEYAVARYLRFNNPVKEGRLAGITVTCFIGCKAVDALMQSKWSASENKTTSLFTTRQSCTNYLGRLLTKGLFHRAIRIEKKKSDRTKTKKKSIKAGSEEETNLEEDKEKRSKKDKKSKKEKEKEKESDREGEKTDDTEKKKEEKEEKKEEEKKKKEKKLKLGMPDDQRFIDGDEVYVWIYDPVPVKTFIIGLLMVLGAIALCLFPLWPEEVRIGVYYLSLSGAGFLAFILVLFVVRLILFCAIWMCTLGKHHFWFLPNLNEDVGFIDSFRPLYKHETYAPKSKDSDKKIKENDKDGVNNGSGDATVSTTATSPVNETQSVSTEKSYEENKTPSEGGTESEASDDQEGFELVDKEELSDEENKDKSETENITEVSEESKKDK
ncbi:SEC62 isoform X2 [Octopus vulgaris]|uniref:SEC62 isoform X2 n=2 Tax=Octopus TaxID=6643 RepID=A0AA36AYN8_OCTVU|nr:translocation protein SEC62 isoform X2 [Octopus sinensis]CAI9724001.1 SEC62 isoform X2 [Octopus vulgaris]